MLNSTVIYFYSLIAMTALYGGFWGMRIVNENQANLSAQGVRVSVAPVHKLLRLMVDIGAALVIQYLIVLIVITYIRLVLGYSFGNQLSWILLASLVACFTGIAFGSCIGAAVKTGEGVKTGILIGSTMIMSLFSGHDVSRNQVHRDPGDADHGLHQSGQFDHGCIPGLILRRSQRPLFHESAHSSSLWPDVQPADLCRLRRQRYASL
jgi:hypothetical protein